MATFTKRRRKDGTTAYFAQIRIRRHGKIAYSESRTFDRKGDASDWAKRREAEIAAFGDDFKSLRTRGSTLGDAIERYVSESAREIGRTKAQVLRAIKSYDIADLPCADLGSVEIVDFARELHADRSPQTVQNYLSHLAAIFAIAKPAWGFPLDAKEMKSAQAVCSRLGLTGKSGKRDRRPSVEEMNKLMDHFERRSASRRNVLPMHRVAGFALFSSRRMDEITRGRWDDFDANAGRILVRDMKHPGDKAGNDIWCDLPEPAQAILEAMPRNDDRTFPYSNDAVSAAFTRACKVLGIDDLRFHDLRHEAVSRLFEMGLSIPQVAQVSGHRSWQSLQRYAHLRQIGDKWLEWEWIERLSNPN